MKKAILIELAWLVGLFVIALLVSKFYISNRALDVSAQDTSYPDGTRFSPLSPFLFIFFTVAGFVAYLIRAIFFRFRTRRISIILVLFNCLLLGAIEHGDYSLYSFLSRAYWEYSAPAITTTVKGLFYGEDASVFRENQYLFWFKVFLILTLSFTSFMIGYYYKLKKQ